MHQDKKQTRRRLNGLQIGVNQSAALMLLLAALVALASQTAQLAAAEPAGSNGQQLAENSIGGQAYSSLVRQPFGGAKRAHKMTFMPLRGRKEGRDEQQQFEGALAAAEEQLLAAASKAASQREIPVDGDASILQLVSAQLAGNDLGELVWRGQPRPAPRQSLTRHRQQQPEAEGGESLFGLGSAGQPAVRMQAKLRRAFHPMRGKKADPSLSSFPPELAYQDELESDSD